MSQYRFIASNSTLPEIDLSGFIRMKVKDIKKLSIVPTGPIPWDELDDEVDVLYTANESDTYGLQISKCNNPPYGLEDYISKPHIYWLGGNFDSKCMDQLIDYLNKKVPQVATIELWSIWFDEGIQEIEKLQLRLENITALDLAGIKESNICIEIR